MTPGKKKCRMLREIRRRIADENDIPYVTEDCKYKGDCKGTCPKCENELRYLEEQLEKRRSLGKRVTVAAVAMGLAASLSACGRQPSGYLEGDVPYTPETEIDTALDGEIAADPETTEPESESWVQLEGDVAYIPAESDENAAQDNPGEDAAPQSDPDPADSARNDG